MIARLSAKFALATVAAVGLTVLAHAPAAAAPNDACYQALAYEKTAANDGVTRQAAYDSSIAGLSANQRCADPQMKLVNEAYLLSMRAGAEHELKIGDWQRDMQRANMLLTQCAGWPGLKGTKAATDCQTQKQYNQAVWQKLTATPAPAASPGPGYTPQRPPTQPPAYTAPPPPPGYQLPTPASPIPSPTPRR